MKFMCFPCAPAGTALNANLSISNPTQSYKFVLFSVLYFLDAFPCGF